MAYSEASKRATLKYIKDKQKCVMVKFKKADFETRIEPAIKKAGVSMSKYIKEAVYEKIERESKTSNSDDNQAKQKSAPDNG